MRARQSLELDVPGWGERKFAGARGQVSYQRGHEDLRSACLRGDAGGQDDRLALEVVSFPDRLARVEPYPYAQPMPVGVSLGDGSLDAPGAPQCVTGRGEREHEPVALRLHL